MRLWDIVSTSALMFTAAVVPFEVAFLPSPCSATEPLFICSRVVDVIFIADIILNFFLAVPLRPTGGILETRHRVLALRYLKGWFLLDLSGVLASLFDILPLALGAGGDCDGGGRNPFVSLRTVRLLRLIKLARLLGASRVLVRLQVRVGSPKLSFTIGASLCKCFLVTHFLACLLGATAIAAASPLDTWFATYGYCAPLDEDEPYGGHVCASAALIYMRSLYWAGGYLFGAPVSLRPPKGPYPMYYSPARKGDGDGTELSDFELGVAMFTKVLCAFVWAGVLAEFVGVYTNLDPEATEASQSWDALNRFIGHFKLPLTDAMELRRYYLERRDVLAVQQRIRVTHNFTPLMKERFVWKLNKEWLVNVPCFSLVVERCALGGSEDMVGFLVQIALSMQPYIFMPSERPPSRRLYVCTHGGAKYRGLRIAPGGSWGATDVLLRGRPGSKRLRAIATSYLKVLYVGTDVFDRLASEYPAAYRLTRLWTCIHAAGEWLLEAYRDTRREQQGWQVRLGHGEDAVSRAHLERQLNLGGVTAERLLDASGQPVCDEAGEGGRRELHRLRFGFVDMSGHVIFKEIDERGKLVYRVRRTHESTRGTTRRPSRLNEDDGLLAANGAKPGRHSEDGLWC